MNSLRNQSGESTDNISVRKTEELIKRITKNL